MSYREPLPKPERGRNFFSPLCATKTEAVDQEWPSVDSLRPKVPKAKTLKESEEPDIPPLVQRPPLPDATRNYDWFSFPTYSEMLQRRLYGLDQSVEDERGYPEDLLRFRREKAEEYKLGASIETADFDERLMKATSLINKSEL